MQPPETVFSKGSFYVNSIGPVLTVDKAMWFSDGLSVMVAGLQKIDAFLAHEIDDAVSLSQAP